MWPLNLKYIWYIFFSVWIPTPHIFFVYCGAANLKNIFKHKVFKIDRFKRTSMQSIFAKPHL